MGQFVGITYVTLALLFTVYQVIIFWHKHKSLVPRALFIVAIILLGTFGVWNQMLSNDAVEVFKQEAIDTTVAAKRFVASKVDSVKQFIVDSMNLRVGELMFKLIGTAKEQKSVMAELAAKTETNGRLTKDERDLQQAAVEKLNQRAFVALSQISFDILKLRSEYGAINHHNYVFPICNQPYEVQTDFIEKISLDIRELKDNSLVQSDTILTKSLALYELDKQSVDSYLFQLKKNPKLGASALSMYNLMIRVDVIISRIKIKLFPRLGS